MRRDLRFGIFAARLDLDCSGISLAERNEDGSFEISIVMVVCLLLNGIADSVDPGAKNQLCLRTRIDPKISRQ